MSWAAGDVGDTVVDIETGLRYTVLGYDSYRNLWSIRLNSGANKGFPVTVGRGRFYGNYMNLKAYRCYLRYHRKLSQENPDLDYLDIIAAAVNCTIYLHGKLVYRRNVTRNVRNFFADKQRQKTQED